MNNIKLNPVLPLHCTSCIALRAVAGGRGLREAKGEWDGRKWAARKKVNTRHGELEGSEWEEEEGAGRGGQ